MHVVSVGAIGRLGVGITHRPSWCWHYSLFDPLSCCLCVVCVCMHAHRGGARRKRLGGQQLVHTLRLHLRRQLLARARAPGRARLQNHHRRRWCRCQQQESSCRGGPMILAPCSNFPPPRSNLCAKHLSSELLIPNLSSPPVSKSYTHTHTYIMKATGKRCSGGTSTCASLAPAHCRRSSSHSTRQTKDL